VTSPLRFPADWRSLGFLVALYTLGAVQWAGAYRHGALWPITATLVFVACIVKHNHIHCRTFRAVRWNRLLDHGLTLATGHPTHAIVTAHNVRHHRHNQTRLDWVRCSLVGFRWNALNLLAFAPASVWTMRRERRDDVRAWRQRRPDLYRRLAAERAVLLGVAGLLLALDWRATLGYVVAPWLAAQWALVTINLLQHQDCDPASDIDHSRNVTGRLVNWLLLNNGFHTVHHLRPALHWSRLPDYHRRHVAPRIRAELVHRSLLGAIWRRLLVERPAVLAGR
jgi:fatty acid desaturase